MTPRLRHIAFIAAALPLGAGLVLALAGLPAFGALVPTSGDAASALSPSELGISNATTAVNFGFRVLDTLGEEFILLAAATGVALLLRDARTDGPAPRLRLDRSEAVRWAAPAGVAGTALVGGYMTVHGHVTPGGGFQGGVVLATALLTVFITQGWNAFRRAAGEGLAEGVEAIGVGGFLVAGVVAGLVTGSLFGDFLPSGTPGHLLSGGLPAVLNVLVGLAVAGGFATIFRHYVTETVTAPEDEG